MLCTVQLSAHMYIILITDRNPYIIYLFTYLFIYYEIVLRVPEEMKK